MTGDRTAASGSTFRPALMVLGLRSLVASRPAAVAWLGGLSLVAYGALLLLGDLRRQTVGFEVAFFAAFLIYLLAVVVVLRDESPAPSHALLLIFLFAVAFRAMLVFTPPRLSDDMYRYVWDGRVQAAGISPYTYPPSALSLR